MADNRINNFHGIALLGFMDGFSRDYYYEQTQIGYIDYEYDYKILRGGDEESVQSPRHCCHAAFARNCVAWAHEAAIETVYQSCGCIELNPKGAYSWGVFVNSGEYQPIDTHIGNGPLGIPLYEGGVYVYG